MTATVGENTGRLGHRLGESRLYLLALFGVALALTMKDGRPPPGPRFT